MWDLSHCVPILTGPSRFFFLITLSTVFQSLPFLIAHSFMPIFTLGCSSFHIKWRRYSAFYPQRAIPPWILSSGITPVEVVVYHLQFVSTCTSWSVTTSSLSFLLYQLVTSFSPCSCGPYWRGAKRWQQSQLMMSSMSTRPVPAPPLHLY